MPDNLLITLHDITLSLTSDNEDFLTYTRAYLPNVILTHGKRPSIDVRLLWDMEFIPNKTSPTKYDRLSRRILIGEHEIIQTQILLLPGLQLRLSEENKRISIKATFKQHRKMINVFSNLRQGIRKEQIYAALIYYLIYFPLSWYAERTLMLFPIHAGAVAMNERAILLTGLGGIGKSTITMAFLNDPQIKLLSENLVLHNHNNIFAFPEVIHLDHLSYSLLSTMTNRLKMIRKTYSHNRACYDISASDRIYKAKPVILINLRQSNKFQISPISSEKAFEMILSNDLLAREINEYSQQRAIFNFLDHNIGGYQRRFDSLREIIGGIPCYDLCIKPREDLGQIVNIIRETAAL
jgi:hypothetical protein